MLPKPPVTLRQATHAQWTVLQPTIQPGKQHLFLVQSLFGSCSPARGNLYARFPRFRYPLAKRSFSVLLGSPGQKFPFFGREQLAGFAYPA